MTKAMLEFKNGTSLQIEGTPEEVHRLVNLLNETSKISQESASIKKAGKRKLHQTNSRTDRDTPSIMNIANEAKNCDVSEDIEKNILDRSSQVDRVLLPLFIIHEYFGNKMGLTSGEISQVLKELGIPIQTPNVANTLAGAAGKYVMGDKVKKKGIAVRYKLSRKGTTYIKGILSGDSTK